MTTLSGIFSRRTKVSWPRKVNNSFCILTKQEMMGGQCHQLLMPNHQCPSIKGLYNNNNNNNWDYAGEPVPEKKQSPTHTYPDKPAFTSFLHLL